MLPNQRLHPHLPNHLLAAVRNFLEFSYGQRYGEKEGDAMCNSTVFGGMVYRGGSNREFGGGNVEERAIRKLGL
jgi:hypothetical protein